MIKKFDIETVKNSLDTLAIANHVNQFGVNIKNI